MQNYPHAVRDAWLRRLRRQARQRARHHAGAHLQAVGCSVRGRAAPGCGGSGMGTLARAKTRAGVPQLLTPYMLVHAA